MIHFHASPLYCYLHCCTTPVYFTLQQQYSSQENMVLFNIICIYLFSNISFLLKYNRKCFSCKSGTMQCCSSLAVHTCNSCKSSKTKYCSSLEVFATQYCLKQCCTCTVRAAFYHCWPARLDEPMKTSKSLHTRWLNHLQAFFAAYKVFHSPSLFTFYS